MKNELHETLPPTELPPIESKALPVPEQGVDKAPDTERSGSKSAELPQTGGPTPVQPAHLTPSAPPHTSQSKPAASSTQGHTPAMADDNDLIEKEWVLKAKAIVASTKQDPYVQNEEMSRYKANYVKKRFNKDISISEP